MKFGHSAMMMKRGCFIDTGDLTSGNGEVADSTGAGDYQDTGADDDIPEGGETDTGDTGGADNAGQQDKGVKQTPEQDRAFADLRRRAEAAEKAKQRADAMIAKQYGQSHGIHTVEQLEEAIAAQEEADRQKAYRDQGIDPDTVNELIERHPLIQSVRQEKEDRFLVDNFTQLTKEFPDMVKQPEDIPPAVWAKWNDGRNGISLVDAFILVNKGVILKNSTAAAKQAALNSVNGKGHIRGSGGGADVETVTIPDDVLAMYKKLNPGKSTEEYQKHYKKSIGR